MAIYEYEILNPDGSVKGVFEAEQKMSEPALTKHPLTGEPLRRILSSTFAHGGGAHDAVSDCSSGACGLGGGGLGGCASGACDWN
jgi:predicted nucleic acid-binding Zn ribbon protein